MPNENQKQPNQNQGFDPKKQQQGGRNIENDDDDDLQRQQQGNRGQDIEKDVGDKKPGSMNEGGRQQQGNQGGQNRPDDRK